MPSVLRIKNPDGTWYEVTALKGDTGITPNLQVGTVTTGNPGTSAEVTITGTPEEPVLNFKIPKGEPGTDGSGMISDKWQNNKNYSANDLCIHNNVLWRCTTQNLGSQPSETTAEWEQITLSQIIPCFTRKIYDVNISVENHDTIGGYYAVFGIPTDDIVNFGLPLYCSVTTLNTHVGICGLTSDNNIYISTKQAGNWQVTVIFAKTALKA